MRYALLLLLILFAAPVAAKPIDFPVIAGGTPAPVLSDPNDDPGTLRAIGDLRKDLEKVAGRPAPAKATDVIIIGTLGRNAMIDRLVAEKRLDVAGIRNQWEAFLVQTVDRPAPGIESALVIVGSDRRGAIFGAYDLSRTAGVSPWHWWADVPVAHHDEIGVASHKRIEKPAVKYRGIFINDEDPALAGWARATFGGVNHEFYERVYELILRMKGNFLWPAMWGKALYDDDPLSAPLANEMGVVIGTSHHEPMMRAHVEWERHGKGPWDYTKNAEVLRDFWRKGVERMGSNESLITVGMRGDGDEPMTEGTATKLLETIVADQRKIIADVTGKPAAETPQVWALYKEVQDYFDKGMTVPDDVTLLFSDDNWGNIRRLPKRGAKRAGGYGVYYHFDYVGGPRNYKWLNTNQIERVWDQMQLAWAHGADRIWIVNVGDIKPMEFPTEFFLDLAWNPDAMPLERLADYPRSWAARQFGEEHAAQIGNLLTRYTQYNARRKPELLSPDTYSLINFREADRVVAEWEALTAEAEALNTKLPAAYRDAYFQLVLHPILASANLNKLYMTVARNRLYAKQGRAAANRLAEEAKALFTRDGEIRRTYEQEIAGGKWTQMMAQTHIGYTGWQQPERDTMPAVESIAVADRPAMGVAVEGDARAWPSKDLALELPSLEHWGPPSRYIDIFNRGAGKLDFMVETEVPWLKVDRHVGSGDTRIEVSVDWAIAPEGRYLVPITIRSADGTEAIVTAPVRVSRASPAPGSFVESDGVVAIEAAHHARAVGKGDIAWRAIPNLGRTLSGVTAVPATAPSQSPGGDSPHLDYRVHLAEHGEVEIAVLASPSLDVRGSQGLRYGMSIDDGPVRIVNIHSDVSNTAWERAVADNIRTSTTDHMVSAGNHTLRIWLVDPGVVFQRIQVRRKGNAVRESYLGPPESVRMPDDSTPLRE